LKLNGEDTWLLEVDYRLLMDALEKFSTGQEETDEEKIEKMKRFMEEIKRGKS